MRRPRLAPLYGAFLIGIQGVLQSVQVGLRLQSTVFRDGLVPFLWLAALSWGLTVGALVHAFWPAPLPGDEKGERAWGWNGKVMGLYLVPTLLFCLFPLAVTLRQPPAPVWSMEDRSVSAIQRFSMDVPDAQLNTCTNLPNSADRRGHWCLYSLNDGYVLAQKLQQAIERNGAQLVGVRAFPVVRQGNLVTGKVHLLAYGQLGDRRLAPITLEYRGLVYLNRTGSLNPQERALAELKWAKSYVVLRPGHV